VHSDSPKIISIVIDSIRQVYTLLLSDGKWEGQIDVLTLVFLVFVPAADSTVTVKYCIQTPSCGRIEWSVFWESRIGMHYCMVASAMVLFVSFKGCL